METVLRYVELIVKSSAAAQDIRLDRIFSVIQILQGTTILRLLPVVLLAPVLDGHSLLCENREQPEESLTLMLQDQTRFMGRQRQTNLPLSDSYA